MDFEPLFPILSDLRPSEQVVLIQLFRHRVNEETYASQSQLIDWTGIKSANTIKAALKALSGRGLIQCLKPGRQNSPALYQLSLESKTVIPVKKPSEIQALDPDDRLRLAAIKKHISPDAWQEIKRESKIAGITVDTYLILKYFGPARVHG